MTSARRWIGALEPCASSTSRTIWASAVSLPTLVARKLKEPVVLIVAPMTVSPARLSTGMRSPVSMRLVHRRGASSTTPSTGTFSPGRTTTRSPTSTWATGTSLSAAVADHAGRLGLQADQRLDRRAGLPLGARLEQPPEQDQRDDERGGVEVHRLAEPLVLKNSGKSTAEDAVDVRRRCAHGDQRVHVVVPCLSADQARV